MEPAGFIGLGAMGWQMAKNLAAARVRTRTRRRTQI